MKQKKSTTRDEKKNHEALCYRGVDGKIRALNVREKFTEFRSKTRVVALVHTWWPVRYTPGTSSAAAVRLAIERTQRDTVGRHGNSKGAMKMRIWLRFFFVCVFGRSGPDAYLAG